MIICLLESRDNVINSQLSKFVNKYPNSSIGFVYDKTPVEKIKKYNKPPLLTAGWLVICEVNQASRLKLVCNTYSNNIVILRAFNRSSFQAIIETLSSNDIAYEVIDNLVISEQEKIKYVLNNLIIDEKDAKYLVRRHHGYMFDIVSSVRTLSGFKPVTRNIITKMTSETNKYRIFDIMNFLLGDDKVSYKDAVGCVYQYRYAFEHLSSYLRTSIENYIKVFEYVGTGSLSLMNYKKFIRESKDNAISAMSEYQLKHMIESYSYVSLDWIFLLEQMINQLGKNDITGLINILALRKG